MSNQEQSNIPEDREPRIEQLMWDLHRALCLHFIGLLKDKEADIKGSTLGALTQFLRDNRVTIPKSDRVRSGDSGVNVHPNGATHVRHNGAICGLNTALSYLPG